jgi:putative membrane protein
MVKNLPGWAHRYMRQDDLKRIEQAVKAAEQRTSGEIVPMLVRRSSPVGLIPVLCNLLMLLLLLAGALIFWDRASGVTPWLWIVVLLLILPIGYGLSQWTLIQRFFLPIDERKASVHQRALLEFHEAGLKKTEGQTGILLFVSLLEREAVVLFDQGIAQHCQPETFQKVVDELISGAKRKDLASGFERAIHFCTELLVPYFPPGKQNPNELKDQLRIKD